MSISDNVLNAAFVPQSQATSHVPAFLSMLTYTSRQAGYWLLDHEIYSKSKLKRTQVYAPPLKEFFVLGTLLDKTTLATETLGAIGGPTIGIVTRGRVTFSASGSAEKETIAQGGIIYVAPRSETTLELIEGEIGEVWWAANCV